MGCCDPDRHQPEDTVRLKKLAFIAAMCAATTAPMSANATLLIGGDAVSQASATSILDIVFAIDTSGSMSDDIASIGAKAQSVIQNLSCPTTDCYIRARFMGLNANSGSFWNENVRSYVIAKGGTPLTNHPEDNGPAVTDLVNHYEWGTDALPGQKNYWAVVTIGDEGTQDGQSVNQADYDAAYQANQAAKAAGVLLFSWVADDPFAGVPALFQVMAEGGTGGGYTFADTGGSYISGPLDDLTVEQQLEDILCAAATGGGGEEVPEPHGLALASLALAGLWGASRRRRST